MGGLKLFKGEGPPRLKKLIASFSPFPPQELLVDCYKPTEVSGFPEFGGVCLKTEHVFPITITPPAPPL